MILKHFVNGTCTPMLTAQEMSVILHMSYRGVLKLIKQKRIKAVKVGKQWLISRSEAERIEKEGA